MKSLYGCLIYPVKGNPNIASIIKDFLERWCLNFYLIPFYEEKS